MRRFQGLGQDSTLVRPAPEGGPPAVTPTVKEIPYDYVATFTLTGNQSNRVQDVINISIDGAFVAMAIGYSFIPAKVSVALPEIPVTGTQPVPTTLTEIIAETIVAQLQLKIRQSTVTVDRQAAVDRLMTVIQTVFRDPGLLLQCLLVRLCGIDFKYSIIDSGTGRELQNQPIHNIAGLGKADGDRPFRPFAKPVLFMPRSTIRIEITEQSEGDFYAGGKLFFVLHGYKILGYGTGLP